MKVGFVSLAEGQIRSRKNNYEIFGALTCWLSLEVMSLNIELSKRIIDKVKKWLSCPSWDIALAYIT